MSTTTTTDTTPTILRVVRGNRRIGAAKHQRLPVVEVRAMGADYSHQCRVVVRLRSGRVKTLWAQHVNRLGDAELNLGDGTGTNRIRVRVEKRGTLPPRSCARCANANWIQVGNSCGR